MALTVFAYTKAKDAVSGDKHINGVQACLYTTDPALAPSDTEAERIALAVAAVQAQVGGNYPTDYFTTEWDLGAAATSDMADDGDVLVVTDWGIVTSGVGV